MTRRRPCPTVKPGRCVQNGKRVMTHTCTHFPGHNARHRCPCGHTWPNTNTNSNTDTDSARRRGWSTES